MSVSARGILCLLLITGGLSAGCTGPQVEADPAWTPAVIVIISTPEGGPAVTATPLDIPTMNYVIKPGETLTDIAERYAMTVEQLANLNGIDNPNKIRAGQVIKVPRRR